MRHTIESNYDENIITYGCSAQILNLLAHDLGRDYENITKHIVQVHKYFRNHHLPKFYYEAAGGSA